MSDNQGGPKVPTPKPAYPDTPWWTNLITAVVVAILSIIGTVYWMKSGAPATGQFDIGAAGIAVDTITYMPHILLLFGVLADMFTYQGVWSIPSLVGLLSIFGNWVMQYFWKGLNELIGSAYDTANPKSNSPPSGGNKKGGAPIAFKNYDGCSVQGFESIRTTFAPQTLVVTATVFCYYIFDLVRNRGWINAAASIAMFGFFYIMQTGVLLMSGGCETSIGNKDTSVAQSVRALFEGIVFGGSAYGIVQTYFPNRLPSSVISPFPVKTKGDLTAGPDGRMYDADGYPYVVLPNGNAVPDLSTQQSRDAFAQLAGANLGTGTPAKPDSCPNA
jgi:hypothetical protein